MLFFDDILVYSASVEDQKHNLRQLFEILRKHKLFAKRSKCSIGRDTVDFGDILRKPFESNRRPRPDRYCFFWDSHLDSLAKLRSKFYQKWKRRGNM